MSNLLSQASLVMIPSGYKEDVVYSQIPTDGSGDLTFTRASNGTRINSAGLVEVAPWNLCTYSEELNIWTTERASVTTNATTAPNGTTTADKVITDSTANNTHQIYIGPFTTPNLSFVISVYAKKSEYNYIHLGTGAASTKTWFDLNNGTVGTQSSDVLSASIESVGNGWYRCINIINNTATSAYVELGPASVDGSRVISGTPSGGIFAWGAQLNIGSTAKPYFPTTDRLNVPRLTYQNGGGGCPSLLLEKQSTNLITYSEQFDNAAWVTSGSNSVTANAITSPDGTQNADFIVSTATNTAPKYVYQVISLTATPTATIYAKAGAVTQMMFYCQGGNGIYFNLTNGAFVAYYGSGASTITSYSSVAVGNGWYRYSMTFNTSVTSIEAYMASGGSISPSIANGDGFYLWGAQLEASSYATSYIPTTSSSATRVADLASVSQGTIANFGSNPFCVFLDVNFAKLSSTGAIALLGNRQSGNWWRIYSNATEFRLEVNGSNGFASEIFLNVGELTSRTKIAVNRNGNDLKIYVNGALAFSQTGAVWSSDWTTGNTQIDFNSWNAGIYEITTTEYNEVVLFKQSLTTTELASLTTI